MASEFWLAHSKCHFRYPHNSQNQPTWPITRLGRWQKRNFGCPHQNSRTTSQYKYPPKKPHDLYNFCYFQPYIVISHIKIHLLFRMVSVKNFLINNSHSCKMWHVWSLHWWIGYYCQLRYLQSFTPTSKDVLTVGF